MIKKILFFILISLILIPQVKAEDETLDDNNKIDIELIKCDSISNIWVNISDEVKRIHLLAFEMESGYLDNEINQYVCNTLNNATSLQIEYDIKKNDKYNRELVYLYVDDSMLQEKLLKNGFGQVNNVQGDYKYLTSFCDIQKEAIIKKIGIWNYPNIAEKYCNSGVEIGSYYKEEKNETEKKVFPIKNLRFMVFLNSGILLLVILLKRNKE